MKSKVTVEMMDAAIASTAMLLEAERACDEDCARIAYACGKEAFMFRGQIVGLSTQGIDGGKGTRYRLCYYQPTEYPEVDEAG